ncbi:MAG: hypothetical protein Q8Q01_00105 [archaeon]|nr:hypothetical protein [archaeon]
MVEKYRRLVDGLENNLDEGLQHGDQGGVPQFDYGGRLPQYGGSGRYSSSNSLDGRLGLAGYVHKMLDNDDYFSALTAVDASNGLNEPGVSNRILYAALAIYGATRLGDLDKGCKAYNLMETLVAYCVKNAGDLLKGSEQSDE